MFSAGSPIMRQAKKTKETVISSRITELITRFNR